MSWTQGRSEIRAAMVAGAALAFGAYYSLIGDAAALLPFARNWNGTRLAALRIASAALLLSLTLALLKLTRSHRERSGGHIRVHRLNPTWFPKGRDNRIHRARQRMDEFATLGAWPLSIATMSGEWDLVLPFTNREWQVVLGQVRTEDRHMRVLLAHPLSDPLRLRCEREPGQDLGAMRSRIINVTRRLTSLSPIEATVRWSLRPITFHVVGGTKLLHFSPFADNLPGHDSPTLSVEPDSPWFEALQRWFEGEWELAPDAMREMEWTERGTLRRKAIFLDRDDTLIKDLAYFGDPDQESIEILPGRTEALRRLVRAGFRLVVVSNQPGMGLGLSSKRELARLTQRIKNKFRAEGVYFDAVYYCTHNESAGCNCRKPKPALFHQASRQFCLKMNECHFIGDSEFDRGVAANIPELKVHILSTTDTFERIVDGILRS